MSQQSILQMSQYLVLIVRSWNQPQYNNQQTNAGHRPLCQGKYNQHGVRLLYITSGAVLLDTGQADDDQIK